VKLTTYLHLVPTSKNAWSYISTPQYALMAWCSVKKGTGTLPFIYIYISTRAVIAQSVPRWAMGWTIGVLGFDCRWGLGIFLFTTASRTALGPTQPPIQWVPGGLSLRVKRLGCKADHSPPSSAEVKEEMELYLHSPNTHSWRGAQLKIGTGGGGVYLQLTKPVSQRLVLLPSPVWDS
jgi:hypothetical protein